MLPDVDVFPVAGLELYQLLAACFANIWVTGCSLVCFFVNAHNLGKRIALQRLSIQQIFPAVNDHPELRAPIAKMIIANDFVPEKLRDARQRVAEHGAADVTDMHRFGNIGRAKINHDASW